MATISFQQAQRWYPGADSPAVPGIEAFLLIARVR